MTGAERQYAAAGVDLRTAEAAKDRIARLVAKTRTGLSVGTVGGFGGMLRLPEGMRRPVLVLSTDGVGTKVLVAREAGRLETVGEDLVNHGVNDILVHGARPLAFQDYLAGAALSVEQIASIVEGVARGCLAHGMVLAGGETAQMPDLYRPGDFDLAGTILGAVEEDEAIHGDRIVPGDVLLGYASTGLHTNGYTLARRVLFERMRLRLDSPFREAGGTVADALLAVHRSYEAGLRQVLSAIHGLAHITGGGIPGNLVRILPPDCEAVVESEAWPVPPLFRLLQEGGGIGDEEMREVFNLGVGMIAVLSRDTVDTVRAQAAAAGVETWMIGEVRRGTARVRYA
ncbi:MAG TPA: phosphoribosylformylglycinamidine cyclo-ligase [Gemmatimonadales bacterium]